LARVLADRGWAVWWDRDLIAGREFDRMIEEQLHAARAVVVLWSEASLNSRWVRSEASAAADRGVLVPAIIADVTTPMQFRNIQGVLLQGWKGQADHPGIEGLDRALRILAGEPGGQGADPHLAPPTATRPQPERSRSASRWRWAAIAGAAAVVVLAIVVVVVLAGGDGKEQSASTERSAETAALGETAAPAETPLTAEDAGSAPIAGCTGASDVPAVVTFVNNEAETVELWYLDEDCVEQLWTTVEAGMTSREDSFVGDYWQVFQPDSGEVLKEFYATAEPSVVVVPAPEDCSAPSDQPASLTVINNRTEPVELYWVRPDCTEAHYNTLQPGDSVELSTYHTEVWSVRRVLDAEQLQVHEVTAAQDLLEIV
jgi:hypothetical protein